MDSKFKKKKQIKIKEMNKKLMQCRKNICSSFILYLNLILRFTLAEVNMPNSTFPTYFYKQHFFLIYCQFVFILEQTKKTTVSKSSSAKNKTHIDRCDQQKPPEVTRQNELEHNKNDNRK